MKRLLPVFLIVAAIGVLRAKRCREYALTPRFAPPSSASGEGSYSAL